MPAIAAEISGKTYTLEDNPFGWQTVAFSFEDGADEVKVTLNGVPFTVGLDNVYRFVKSQDNTFPQGFRGHWDQDTFVVETIVLGQMMQTTSRIQFSGDAIHLTWQEKSSGNTVEVQGTLNPATK